LKAEGGPRAWREAIAYRLGPVGVRLLCGVPRMISVRSVIMLTSAASVVLALSLSSAGCGSQPAEFDNAANYTPESLAQELVVRYRALNADTKKSKRAPARKLSDAAIAARDNADSKKKARTAKTIASTTIDDVLDDMKYKISLIKGTSATETTKKMIETISSDRELADSDKKSLTEHVGRLAE
jgi:hypothetical protein